MSEPFDYSVAQQRIWVSLDKKEYLSVADELKQMISFLEVTGATEYIDYIEYQFLLHQVYAELKDWQSSIKVLRELTSHFLQKTDPRMLTPRGMELYIKTWTYLGYRLSEDGRAGRITEDFQALFAAACSHAGSGEPGSWSREMVHTFSAEIRTHHPG